MDAVGKLALLADLSESTCELRHYKENPPKACDYVVVPLGYKESENVEVREKELVIPVCQECAETLQGEEWTLLYCFECNSSRWISRELAKNSYRHHVLWLRGCPDCSNKFGGLYFNDLDVEPIFLKDVANG